MAFLKIINKKMLYCYAIFINCYELLFITNHQWVHKVFHLNYPSHFLNYYLRLLSVFFLNIILFF
eukprot:SAG11_NODE_61_length_19011_cov_49.624048_18_plen_65_part_00